MKYSKTALYLARSMTRDGCTHKEIYEALSISESAFYKWRDKYVEFYNALILGKMDCTKVVEEAMLERAIGTTKVDSVIEYNGEGVVIKETVKETEVLSDVNAQKAYLQAKGGDEWKPKVEVKVDTNEDKLGRFLEEND